MMDLDYLAASDVRQRIHAGTLSPVTYVEYLLERIARIEPLLHAFTYVMAEPAMSAARAAETAVQQRHPLGPLHGVPVAVKDNIDVEGVPTKCQSRLLLHAPPARQDAAVVARLRQAGAIIMGKLALEEFAIGDQPADLPWPPTCNPWDLARTPGGSSCGAGAAVAAGLVPIAVGTDAGGSVRNPAALCGVVGLKPTFGLLPTDGVFPLAPSLDHVGVLTRTVADNVLTLRTLVTDTFTTEGPALADLRIGLVTHYCGDDHAATSEVVAAIEAARETLCRLGARVCEVELDSLPRYDECGWVTLTAEGYKVHEAWLRDRPQDYSSTTRNILLRGRSVDALRYSAAQQVRVELRELLASTLSMVDVLITAVTTAPACRLDDVEALARSANGGMRMPFNVTGNPALAVPIGFSQEGLPLSLQIVARPFAESLVYRVASAYEAASNWHRQHPPWPVGGPTSPPLSAAHG